MSAGKGTEVNEANEASEVIMVELWMKTDSVLRRVTVGMQIQ